MTGQLSLLSALEDTIQPNWACSGWLEAEANDCDVFVKNVHKVDTGAYTKYPYIEVKMARCGEFILFEYSYGTGGENNYYGCGSPLSYPCNNCHRSNSAKLVAEVIINTFINDNLEHDPNLTKKSRAELAKKIKAMRAKIEAEVGNA